MKRLGIVLMLIGVVWAQAQTPRPAAPPQRPGVIARANILSRTVAGLVAATSCVQGAKGAPLAALLSFTAPTTNTDGTPVTLPLTYNVYQGSASGTETKVLSGQTSTSINITAGLVSGGSAFFYVTATNPSGEGPPSVEVCKSFPAAPPSAPANLAIS